MESLPCQPEAEPESSILPTLEQVQAHFQRWRSTRQTRGTIPPALWDQVSLLIGRYPESEILKKLQIHKLQLNAFMSKKQQNEPQSLDFVHLSMPQAPRMMNTEPASKNPLTAEVLHPNGMILRLPSLNEQQFSNLLCIFIKGP
jgi:hypothetical protein